MNPVKRFITLVAIILVIEIPALLVGGAAGAADWNRPSRIYKPNNGWVAMYDVPRVTNYPKAWLQSGKAFYMDCWIDNPNGWWNGNYGSARWFAGYGGGYYGYVHSSYVTNQIWVPHC